MLKATVNLLLHVACGVAAECLALGCNGLLHLSKYASCLIRLSTAAEMPWHPAQASLAFSLVQYYHLFCKAYGLFTPDSACHSTLEHGLQSL